MSQLEPAPASSSWSAACTTTSWSMRLDRPRKGETVTGPAWRPKFGGKGGNQAVAAARAAFATAMVGAVGNDDFGHLCSPDLERARRRPPRVP